MAAMSCAVTFLRRGRGGLSIMATGVPVTGAAVKMARIIHLPEERGGEGLTRIVTCNKFLLPEIYDAPNPVILLNNGRKKEGLCNSSISSQRFSSSRLL